jgi:hypothetical protein
MKNLKRFRSWIAFVAAAFKIYLQQRASAKGAEDRPNSDTPQSSCSATVVTATPKSMPAPAKSPAIQVTTDITPANGKAHQSAQRLARVLISEIKLYYLNKMEGQDASEIQNIYDLLKDPIDKSRQHYEQRVGADASSMPDYFHGELVKTLCDGDASRLGPNYSTK